MELQNLKKKKIKKNKKETQKRCFICKKIGSIAHDRLMIMNKKQKAIANKKRTKK